MGKSSTKERKSIKLTPGKRQQYMAALVEIRVHYADLLASWDLLTENQKRDVLASSSVLSELKNMTEILRG